MSIYQDRINAIENNNADEFIDTLHDDFVFVSHIDGSSIDLSGMSEMIRGMMSNDDFAIHENRCLYENDDVIVEHAVMSFPDNTREAVLSCHTIKDGKVIRTETGATVLGWIS